MKSFKQICSEIATKHRIGNSLVTGHKYAYFEEAALEFAKQAVDECANSAEIVWETDYLGDEWLVIDRDSILKVKELLR